MRIDTHTASNSIECLLTVTQLKKERKNEKEIKKLRKKIFLLRYLTLPASVSRPLSFSPFHFPFLYTFLSLHSLHVMNNIKQCVFPDFNMSINEQIQKFLKRRGLQHHSPFHLW